MKLRYKLLIVFGIGVFAGCSIWCTRGSNDFTSGAVSVNPRWTPTNWVVQVKLENRSGNRWLYGGYKISEPGWVVDYTISNTVTSLRPEDPFPKMTTSYGSLLPGSKLNWAIQLPPSTTNANITVHIETISRATEMDIWLRNHNILEPWWDKGPKEVEITKNIRLDRTVEIKE